MPKGHSKAICGNASDTTWWPTLEPNIETMQVTKPDEQIQKQCLTNQKMQIQTKYKSVFKKYRKFEIEKYMNT